MSIAGIDAPARGRWKCSSLHKYGDKADAGDRQARDDPSATYQELPYGGSWIIAARAVVAGQPSSGAGLVEPAF